MMKKHMALLTLVCTLLQMQCMQANISIAQMNETEQKTCGIEKLSPEEKHALDTWLAAQKLPEQPKLQPVTQKSKITHGEFAITANQDLGRYIMLDNGLTYEFPSRSRKKTMAWKVGEKVKVVEPVRPVTFKLENVVQNQTIGGKAVPTPVKLQKETKAE